MEVLYFCADPHNQPIDHPKVTTFTDLAELPALCRRAAGISRVKGLVSGALASMNPRYASA